MIDTRKIAQEYRLTHWAQVMRKRTESGLSIKDYCKQVGISTNTYFYWQKRLRESVCEKLPANFTEDENHQLPAVALKGWAVCEVAQNVSNNEETTVTIEIGKSRVTANADTNVEFLKKICEMLVTLC
jgi:transposase-like protein